MSFNDEFQTSCLYATSSNHVDFKKKMQWKFSMKKLVLTNTIHNANSEILKLDRNMETNSQFLVITIPKSNISNNSSLGAHDNLQAYGI